MSKIQGWTKIKDGEYISTVNFKKHPYNGTQRKSKIDIYFSNGIEFPFHKGWYVNYSGISGYIRSKRFNLKKEAMAYAINHMKSHPRG